MAVNDAFHQELEAVGRELEAKAQWAVEQALKAGADECVVSVSNASGIDVSTRHMKTENVTFNKNRSMGIVVYRNKKSGTASTTDLEQKSIADCIEAAVRISDNTDPDPCAGICDKEDLCTDVKDFGLTYPMFDDIDKAVEIAASTEDAALSRKDPRIKDSDGAYFGSWIKSRVLATSNGFCQAQTGSSHYYGLTLIGESSGRMQRGSGFTSAPDFEGLWQSDAVVNEACDEVLGRLDAQKPKTGRYNVIFTKNAARSLWNHLRAAISGRSIYLQSSFLCGCLGEQILPSFITIHEDPHVFREPGSRSFDSEGAATFAQDWVKDGVLQEYLLSSYSARKLGLRTNAHSGGVGAVYFKADAEHEMSLDKMMAQAGEGIVIDQAIGQGVDIVSGNYSRGASGFYFKNGKREYPVQEFTVAANLKDLYLQIAALGTDIDERFRYKAGSILIPDLAVSAA